jgi:hypothetical protein
MSSVHREYESTDSPFFSFCSCARNADHAAEAAPSFDDVAALCSTWGNAIEHEGFHPDDLREYVDHHVALAARPGALADPLEAALAFSMESGR